MPRLDDVIGQSALKNLLFPKTQMARERRVALPHLLLCGETEQGKLTLASAIAEELNVPFRYASAAMFVNLLDMSGMFTNVTFREVLAIENVDAIHRPLLDAFVEAVSRFQMEITLGSGPGARKHTISLPQFTLVGTTNKPWLVDERIRRWCTVCKFAPYTLEEATQIVIRIAESKNILLDGTAAAEIATQCRLRPGEANVFLQRLASHFPFDRTERIDRERLRLVNEFLGAGDLFVDSLAVAEAVKTMAGTEFEHWVAELFRRAGFRVEVTQASGDHGVDLWATLEDGVVAVQCKRWDGPVGEPVLRDLYGVVMAARAQSGCLVTTGSFTTQAHTFCKDKPLHLIGFDSLMEATRSPELLVQMLYGRQSF